MLSEWSSSDEKCIRRAGIILNTISFGNIFNYTYIYYSTAARCLLLDDFIRIYHWHVACDILSNLCQYFSQNHKVLISNEHKKHKTIA